jgi:hypothetical protein
MSQEHNQIVHCLFNHLVGAQPNRKRYLKTERRSGLAVHDHLELGRELHRENVPQEIIGKLNAAAVEALADQRVRTRLADLGFEVYPRERQTPEALNALRKADAEKWWPIIKELGMRPD